MAAKTPQSNRLAGELVTAGDYNEILENLRESGVQKVTGKGDILVGSAAKELTVIGAPSTARSVLAMSPDGSPSYIAAPTSGQIGAVYVSLTDPTNAEANAMADGDIYIVRPATEYVPSG